MDGQTTKLCTQYQTFTNLNATTTLVINLATKSTGYSKLSVSDSALNGF